MIGKFLKLTNGLKFMVLDQIEHDKERYFFLASVTEDVQYVFARLLDDNGLEPVTDGDLVLELTSKVSEKVFNQNKE